MLTGLVMTLVWGVDRWAHYLYGKELPLIYGRLPYEYLFTTMDIGVVCVFMIRGTAAAWRELGGGHAEANR
jgi:hypothetical protein